MSATTRDKFLGGRLTITQPAKGYRAGVDAVFLAAAVTASPGQSVLELGCGVGVASLCLQARVGALDLTGLEVQTGYAALARQNALENALPMEVVTGDLSDMPSQLRARQFDHVLANPPYYRRAAGTASDDAGREKALGETAPLTAWVEAAVRRLHPKGYMTIIQKADRLPDLMAACDSRLGDVSVLPLVPRVGRAAELVILRARKGARGPFRLLSPMILHSGEHHEADGDSYLAEISAILRFSGQICVDWRK